MPRQDNDEVALQKIKTEVRDRLANAATMSESKGRYSAKAQTDFENIWWYVREWLGEGETETRGTGKGGAMQELLDALKKLIERYEQPV